MPAPFSRILVIYNPAAGPRRRRALSKVLRQLRTFGCDISLKATRARGDAEAFARQARQAREMNAEAPDVVVAAGGDGTINEVLNGMNGADLPLAIIPLGTANVLAAEIGLSSGAAAVARTIVEGDIMSAYLGSANGRVFAVMAGVGMDAEVVDSVSHRLKRWIGKGAYAWAIVRRLMRPLRARFDVVIDGETKLVASVVVANGHYYGGRFVCARNARLEIGEMHACLFKDATRLGAIRYLVWMALGRLEKLPSFEIVPCREVTVFPKTHGTTPDVVQGDGDIITTLPTRFEILRTPLKLLVPSEGKMSVQPFDNHSAHTAPPS